MVPPRPRAGTGRFAAAAHRETAVSRCLRGRDVARLPGTRHVTMRDDDFVPHKDRRERSAFELFTGIALAVVAILALYALVDAFAHWNKQQACVGSGRRCVTTIEAPR